MGGSSDFGYLCKGDMDNICPQTVKKVSITRTFMIHKFSSRYCDKRKSKENKLEMNQRLKLVLQDHLLRKIGLSCGFYPIFMIREDLYCRITGVHR